MSPPAQPQLPAMRLVRSPVTPRKAALALALFLAALALALLFAPWIQNVTGKGRVIAYAPLERRQTIEAAVEGRIVRWFVQEGDQVSAGESLVEISDNDPDLVARLGIEKGAQEMRLSAAVERARSIEERIAALEEGRSRNVRAATSRIDVAQQHVIAAKRAVENAEESSRVANLQIERLRSLSREGLASTRQVELAEADLVRAHTDVLRARAALDAAESERDARTSDRDRADSDGTASIADARASLRVAIAEQAQASAEIARMDVRLARQSAQLITAPRAGRILRVIAAQGGEMVKPGDPLLVLVPDTQARAVELSVAGNDAPLIRPGRRVRLQFEGWPAVQFAGWPSVAVGTFGGKVAFVDSADDGLGGFRVVVVPDPREPSWPEPQYLRQGVRANGWFLLDEVRLGWELWRQMNGFPPTVTSPESSSDGKASSSGKTVGPAK